MNAFNREVLIALCGANASAAAGVVVRELARRDSELEHVEYKLDEARKQLRSFQLDYASMAAELTQARALVTELEHRLKGAVYIVPCSDGDEIEFEDFQF